MDDREILELYNVRSETAIAQTAEKYGAYCHAIAFHILQSAEDAEECVSDAYWNAWNSIPPKAPVCFRSFLGKLTRHVAFDRYRRSHADKRGAGQLPLALEELGDCVPVSGGISDDWVIRDALNRFLVALPAKERRIFLRRYWYVDSAKDIAQTLGTSENSVNVTLYRTRQKLKKHFEKEGISL